MKRRWRIWDSKYRQQSGEFCFQMKEKNEIIAGKRHEIMESILFNIGNIISKIEYFTASLYDDENDSVERG